MLGALVGLLINPLCRKLEREHYAVERLELACTKVACSMLSCSS